MVYLISIYYMYHMEYPASAKGAFIFCKNTFCMTFLLRDPLRYVTGLANMQHRSVI